MDSATRVAAVPAGVVEYRLDPGVGGPAEVVVLMHGGHLRAGLPVAERSLHAAGCTLLVPSRPGYGRTPLRTGPTVEVFADATAQLCAHLRITSVRAVIGVSAGGPAAVALAERHPDLVHRLLLVSARSALPFPTGATRLAARLAFDPHVEAGTWAAVRALLHRSPARGLRAVLASLSTLGADEVVADLSPREQQELVQLFASMRSGRGFAHDVRTRVDARLGSAVGQPALVVASRRDGQVDWRHAEHLEQHVHGARLWESPSLSHLVWYGSGAASTEERILAFLDRR